MRKRRFPPYPKRPHASGAARISIHGHHVYLGPFGSPESWTEYNRRLALWQTAEATGNTNRPKDISTLTVADVCARWLAHAKEIYSERGREFAQHRRVCLVLVRLFGPDPAASFDSGCLETFQIALATGSWMTEDDKRDAKKHGAAEQCTRGTINRKTVRVKTMWRWLEKRHMVPNGSHHHLATVGALDQQTIRKHNIKTTHKRPLATWEKVAAVLPHIQTYRVKKPVRAMLELQWWSGMRSGEVRIMRTCDIDRSGPKLDGVTMWLYRPFQHKNDWREGAEDEPRVVPLGPECQKILEPWLRPDEPEAFLFSPKRKDAPRPYFTAAGYAQAVRRGAKRAGVDLEPYDCRHAAKMRFTKALGADAARAMLGQKSIKSTEHYGEIDLQHAIEAARKLA